MRILTFILFLLPLIGISQIRLDRDTLPALVISKTDTIGIVFSIEAVEKIDRNLEVLHYTELLVNKMDENEFQYITLVNDLKNQNTLFKYKILNLMDENNKMENMNLNLKEELRLSEEETSINYQIIDNKDNEIKALKTRKGVDMGIILLLLALLVVIK